MDRLFKTAPALHAELRELILTARERVAQAVNAGLTLLYWQVGDRIRREVLKGARAAYLRADYPSSGDVVELMV